MSFNPYRFWETNPAETYVKSKEAFALHLTGSATVAGNLLVGGTARIAGPATVTGNFTVSGTSNLVGAPRIATGATEGAIYLGTGTKAIAWCAVTVVPGAGGGYTGVGTGYDIGSVLIGGTAPGLYWKTGYAATNWASADAYDS